MDVLSYLTTLIQSRKAVGISGLGTVFKKKIPGRYDAEMHAFVPPSYTIDFTPELKEEESLAAYICEKRNVKHDTALYIINEFSTEVIRKLNIDREAELGELGKLVKVADHISFEPNPSINYGFDFYGLPALKEEGKIENKAETPVDETTNPFAQYKRTEAQLQEEIESLNFYRSKSAAPKGKVAQHDEALLNLTNPTQGTNLRAEQTVETPNVFDDDEPENKTIPFALKLLYGLIFLALITGIVYISKPELFHQLTGKPNSPEQAVVAVPVTKAIDSASIHDSIQKHAAAQPKIQVDTLLSTLPAVKTDTVTVYEIIGASMHNQKEANDFIALMKRSGIEAKVVTNMSGKRLKMSIATLKDEQSAKEELDRLSKKLKIPGIYIYRNKQK